MPSGSGLLRRIVVFHELRKPGIYINTTRMRKIEWPGLQGSGKYYEKERRRILNCTAYTPEVRRTIKKKGEDRVRMHPHVTGSSTTIVNRFSLPRLLLRSEIKIKKKGAMSSIGERPARSGASPWPQRSERSGRSLGSKVRGEVRKKGKDNFWICKGL